MEGMQQQPPNQAPPLRVQISAAEFGAKYRSKREVYNFLAVDAGVYLPAYGKSSRRCSFGNSLILIPLSFRHQSK